MHVYVVVDAITSRTARHHAAVRFPSVLPHLHTSRYILLCQHRGSRYVGELTMCVRMYEGPTFNMPSEL